MNEFVAAIREARDVCEDRLSESACTRLGDLISMFEDHSGDTAAEAKARHPSTLQCKNCEFSWPGFFLPMDMNGRGPMTTIRLAVCPRCYGNSTVFLHRATPPKERAAR